MDGYVYAHILRILNYLECQCLTMDHLQQELTKIESETHLSKNHILEVLYKLEEYGYVLRAYGKSDTSYHITTKGKNLMARIKKNTSLQKLGENGIIPFKSKS
ncbi:DUF3116 family protein [Listeria fleischmannii]|uniref:Protein of uncharacterized function (DUF3116) n=2 Tax=Listeria fleischmannii TaxID=1069827 RepID=A0A2X3GV31_9LIST|nr:DUF3116 family protein [Listeria fleischmannii]EMG29314.1 hypothetical protein LFLEISCH_00070 [Listeria fleischmannii subsp. fleischmannii LU2006-1]SQC72208.1 Protein of uncharacterised function (DUF3116) [Listeria fleischmannii subsp. fleischmannii]